MSAISSQQPFFCLPPLGRPDPIVPRPLKGPDTRERVIRRVTKAGSNWMGVFNILRDEVLAPNTEQPGSKEKEKTFSIYDKDFANWTSVRVALNYIDNSDPAAQKFLKLFTKEAAQLIDPRSRLFYLERSMRCDFTSYIPGFLEQSDHQNFYDYLKLAINLRFEKIHSDALSKLGTNFEKMFETVKQIEPLFKNLTWSMLPLLYQQSLLAEFVKIIAVEHFNLQISPWQPSDTPEKLGECLKKFGPLAVQIKYEEPTQKLTSKKGKEIIINGRPVFAWPKDAPGSAKGKHAFHLIVGFDPKASLVFLINGEGSDPRDAKTQPIFAMSYKRLTSPNHILDNLGIRRNTTSRQIGYGYHRRPADAQDSLHEVTKSQDADSKESKSMPLTVLKVDPSPVPVRRQENLPPPQHP